MESEDDVDFEAMTLEERNKYCEGLDDFIKDVEETVKAACDSLKWTYESLGCELEPYMTCPFNSGHRVPERTMEKHLKKCEWNSLGYTKECKPLPESYVSEESPSTIKFDIQLQHKVLREAKIKNPTLNIGEEEKLIPQTSDRLISDFTPDERKAMYEYVIANTVAPDIGQDIADLNNPEKSKAENAPSNTILELLAQERNLKRRRAKHRGVHTNKKSHTEVLREIVEKQMDMFKEYIAEKHGIPIPDDEQDGKNEDDRLHEKSDKTDFENSNRRSSSKREYQKDLDQSEQSSSSKSWYKQDYDNDYKNSSRDQKHRSISRRYNRSDEHYEKHESRRRDRHNSNDRNNEERNKRRRSKSSSRDRHRRENSRHRDTSDSRGKYRDDSGFQNKNRDENGDYQGRHRDNSGSRVKCRGDDESQEHHRDGSGSRNQRRDIDATRNGHRNGSRSRCRDDSDSRGKTCNQNDSQDYSETGDTSGSRDHKRDRSRSRERKKESKHDSRVRSDHKKHKKDKKKREKSVDNDNDYGKHKVSKR